MRTRRTHARWLGAVSVVAALAAGTAAHAQARATTPVPSFRGPIAVTPTSVPYLAANRLIEPIDLAALGYVDIELLEDGSAVASWVEARPQQAPEIRLRRIEPSGTKGPAVAVPATGRPTGSPRMARIGDDVLLAWTESAPPAGGSGEGVLQVKTAAARVPRTAAVK